MSLVFAAVLVLSTPNTSYFANQSLLIGYRSEGKWHVGTSLQSKKVRIKFRQVGIGILLGSSSATGLTHVTNGPEGVYLEGKDGDFPGIEFSGPVSVPRRVRILSTQNRTYVNQMSSFLKTHGVRGTVRLTRAIATDLDGDGKTETILEAASRNNLIIGGMSAGRNGDYSVVLLRYSLNGKIVEQPLEFDHPKAGEMPYLNKVVAIADFEGHGKMQIAVTNDYYEGTSTSLWQFSHGKLDKLIENGVGA